MDQPGVQETNQRQISRVASTTHDFIYAILAAYRLTNRVMGICLVNRLCHKECNSNICSENKMMTPIVHRASM